MYTTIYTPREAYREVHTLYIPTREAYKGGLRPVTYPGRHIWEVYPVNTPQVCNRL